MNLLSPTLKVEAKGPSAMPMISTGLHGVTHKKAVILHPQECTGTRLSDDTYTDLSSSGNYLLLLVYLVCSTNHKNIPFEYLLHLLVQGPQGPLVCFLECS
jgi:hypothetical protein